uniref:eL22 n=1 Tax=Paranosema locustae TaxID=235221 RepID=UPI00187D6DC8|nr:Chain LU0, eL22 [Paranosema locustae]
MNSVQAENDTRCYELNCSVLVKDSLLSTEDLNSYLEARMKVNGRTGNLAGNIDLVCTEESILVKPRVRLSKKYLKYLVKKFLYKKELIDWVRILSTGKSSYKLAYYRVVSNKYE